MMGVHDEVYEEVAKLRKDIEIAHKIIEKINGYTPYYLATDISHYLLGDESAVERIMGKE